MVGWFESERILSFILEDSFTRLMDYSEHQSLSWSGGF
jgi:hypothetical protein